VEQAFIPASIPPAKGFKISCLQPQSIFDFCNLIQSRSILFGVSEIGPWQQVAGLD
jgi:hypothetical protein